MTRCALCGLAITWEYPGAWAHEGDGVNDTHNALRRVRLDGSPSWLAEDHGEGWNGFAVPHVTGAVRDEIAAWLDTQGAIDDGAHVTAREVRALPTDGEGGDVYRIDLGLTFSWVPS